MSIGFEYGTREMAYTGHEKAKSTTETKPHHAGDDGLSRT